MRAVGWLLRNPSAGGVLKSSSDNLTDTLGSLLGIGFVLGADGRNVRDISHNLRIGETASVV